jgi:hypothetical protein
MAGDGDKLEYELDVMGETTSTSDARREMEVTEGRDSIVRLRVSLSYMGRVEVVDREGQSWGKLAGPEACWGGFPAVNVLDLLSASE